MNSTRKQLRTDLAQARAAWVAAPPRTQPAPLPASAAVPPTTPARLPRAAATAARAQGLLLPPANRRDAVRNFARSAQEVLRPTFQRAKTPPEAVPIWPRVFVADSAASFEKRLADLERGTRRAMGPVALRGIEWGVRLGLSIGGAASLALAFVPGAQLPFPALGVAVVAAAVVAGLVVGAIVQAVARAHFARRHPGFAEGVLQKLLELQTELLAQTPADDAEREAQVRQLRRIELLQHDVEGGLRHAGWQVLFAVVNVDPRLAVLMRTRGPRASGGASTPEAAESAAEQPAAQPSAAATVGA